MMDYLPQIGLSRLVRLYGRYQCRKGGYSQQTYKLFAYSKNKSLDSATQLDYVIFKHNLGEKSSLLQLKIIARHYHQLSTTQKLLLLNLLLEADPQYDLLHLITPDELASLSLRSPVIAAYRLKHMPYVPAEVKILAAIHQQKKWQDQFFKYINKNIGSIIVVDEGSSLKASATLDQLVDAHQVVVRIAGGAGGAGGADEKGCSPSHGQKVDVWVQSLGEAFPEEFAENSIKWIVLTGADVLYTLADWDFILPHLARGTRVLTVPLDVWKPLVKKIDSPPTSKLLFMSWVMYRIPNYRNISVLGFLTKSIKKIRKNFYPFKKNIKLPAELSRVRENALFINWKTDGLHFIDGNDEGNNNK